MFSTLQKDNIAFNEEDVMFFEHQLDLYGKLAYVSILSSFEFQGMQFPAWIRVIQIIPVLAK